MKNVVATLTALLILAGCSSTPPPAPDTRAKDTEAIRAAEVQANADWASKDVDRIARFWADDATLLLPGQPALKGNAAIKASLKDMVADPKLALTFSATTIEVSKSGDVGYSEGTASMTMTDPKTKKVHTENGKYLTVYRKQADGSWRAMEDMYNADGAPVAEKSSEKPSAAAPAKGKKVKAIAAKKAKKKR